MFAAKDGRTVTLVPEKYPKDPFAFWKNNLTNPRYLISAIPFVRNLAEYCGHTDEYEDLTSLLHMKSGTNSITCEHLKNIYNRVLNNNAAAIYDSADKCVLTLIMETASSIVNEAPAIAELESKIVLSIAIRLRSEQHMIAWIADPEFSGSIRSNQTQKLFAKYKITFPDNTDQIALISQVNLMTPENIHLNSFMYEPILDMDSTHLRDLYTRVNTLPPNNHAVNQ